MSLLEIFAWITAACTALAGLIWLARTVGGTGRIVINLRDDLLGEPARQGVPARPGVMERMARIEGELTFNGGKSLKDTVTQINERLARIEQVGNAPVQVNVGMPQQTGNSPSSS
jgi:hypothetical protein